MYNKKINALLEKMHFYVRSNDKKLILSDPKEIKN